MRNLSALTLPALVLLCAGCATVTPPATPGTQSAVPAFASPLPPTFVPPVVPAFEPSSTPAPGPSDTPTSAAPSGAPSAAAEPSTFRYEEGSGFLGALTVTGYAAVETVPEPFCEEDCATYQYVTLVVLNTDAEAFAQYAEENVGNAYLGRDRIGIGCVEDGVISYENHSDDKGMREYRIDPELSQRILGATQESPVTLTLERLRFTGGSGAPACYSHFTFVREAP